MATLILEDGTRYEGRAAQVGAGRHLVITGNDGSAANSAVSVAVSAAAVAASAVAAVRRIGLMPLPPDLRTP